MDSPNRLATRQRPPLHLERDRNAMPDDSSGESESNFVRRKFQRTAVESNSGPDTTTFRKPSLPASATRAPERVNSISQRRRSVLRDTRVPSGPREYPSPGRRNFSFGASNLAGLGSGPVTKSADVLPHSSSESILSTSMANSRFAFGQPLSSANSAITSPDRAKEGFNFLPDITFDDFQTSLQSYDGNGTQLSDFSAVVGEGRRLLSRDADIYGIVKDTASAASTSPRKYPLPQHIQHQQGKTSNLDRTPSLRQRMAARAAATSTFADAGDHPNLQRVASASTRDRRKSSAPQSTSSVDHTSLSAVRPPRKSVGPGLLAGARQTSGELLSGSAVLDAAARPTVVRTSSTSKARRTTLHASVSSTADLPRLSTVSASAAARANKSESIHLASKDQADAANVTPMRKPLKAGHNRTHSPSSSGNKRQSTISSGRVSGLGARTISPTDTKRQQRMSMASIPPLPKPPQKNTPTPQEELSNQLSNSHRLPDASRLAQPSPSMIPRKAGTVTPSSASESFDCRPAVPGAIGSLATKSSYSSIAVTPGVNNSASRLPMPRGRQSGQSGSAMAQYSDQYSEPENDEIVPPVPAIPKAYESPKDTDHAPFLSSSMYSSNSAFAADANSNESALGFHGLKSSLAAQYSRADTDDEAPEPPPKTSSDLARPIHRRNHTSGGDSGVFAGGAVTATPSRPARPLPDPSGRQNVNLQPIRLPPLNMLSLSQDGRRQPSNASMPRPSQEIGSREDLAYTQTPEPKRAPKTPSTPMTASKATFFRRQEDQMNMMRSTTSHYALRDNLAMDGTATFDSQAWNECDMLPTTHVALPNRNDNQRSTVTPFSSGSLPKRSGEFRDTSRELFAYCEDEYSLGRYTNLQLQSSKPQGVRVRAQTGGPISSFNRNLPQTPNSRESPVADTFAPKEDTENKEKESSSTGGLRRKLSLGWRRASSKNAHHASNKTSPPQYDSAFTDKEKATLLQHQLEMPPPKLPASATWSGNLPTLSASTSRPGNGSDAPGHLRQSSGILSASTVTSTENPDARQISSKLTRLYSEQPQPVSLSHGTRSSSWGVLPSSTSARSSSNVKPMQSNVKAVAKPQPALSAIVKDKDDLAADEEMQRLSRKRKDVDSAARESEDLRKRAVPVAPLSVQGVLHDRHLSGGSSLNVFERGEIIEHEKDGIFFTGSYSARKVVGVIDPSSQAAGTDGKDGKGGGNNFGYDDERGDYNIVIGDHLAYRYEVVDVLGKGSFGQVVRCVDHKEGSVVAIKIIRNKKRFHQQALVEVGILGKLKQWDPNGAHATLSVTGSFYFRNHLCIVTPCLSINLYELIRAHNFVGFQMPLIRRFARQLLSCLTLLQTKRIIHCDLKPENILLCEARKADVRVIDFGSSCREEEKVYTYIQSRFYRSPEVILGSQYGLGIDMWSLGCILAELWTGYPLFPGENEQEQLACIMEIFGPPDRHLVDKCTRKKLFFDSVGKPRVTVSSKGRRRRPSSKTLQQALKTDDEAFLDFIARCLRWDPDRRLKPSDAVNHPFITNQSLNSRQSIPDEARRVARPRPGASAAPSTNVPSPVKRNANAFAHQQNQSNQTSIAGSQATSRTGPSSTLNPGTSTARVPSVSPVKPPFQSSTKDVGNRRHSTMATAGAMATAGNKRAPNGTILTGDKQRSATGSAISASKLQNGTLAAIAARESMAGTTAATAAAVAAGGLAGTGRWRS